MEYIGEVMAVISIVILAVGVIINEEKWREKISRSGSILVRWIIYTGLDYGLMIVSILLVMIMKKFGFWLAFVAMWIFDMIVATILLEICYKSKQDLTLGREYRDSVKNIWKKSRIAGIVSIFLIVVKSALWDGPERLCEFFYNEMDHYYKVFGIIFVLCFVQAFFWTSTYLLGLETISQVWEVFRSKLS